MVNLLSPMDVAIAIVNEGYYYFHLYTHYTIFELPILSLLYRFNFEKQKE